MFAPSGVIEEIFFPLMYNSKDGTRSDRHQRLDFLMVGDVVYFLP